MKQDHPQKRSAGPLRRSKLCRTLLALDGRIHDALGKLSRGQRGALLLAISLLFAGAMIGVALFQKPGHSQTTLYVLIAIWWIPFSALSRTKGCDAP